MDVGVVTQLGSALWNLKVMCDQHADNKREIKELQSFMQDYGAVIPGLTQRFKEGGGNALGIGALKNLEKDITEAIGKLERWSRNKNFFRVFTSTDRMQKLVNLHSKVMASVQKSSVIANLSMLLDVQATQATLLESNVELKSLLMTSIGSVHGTLPSKVRHEVVEASISSFADSKFWEDILAAVDIHNGQFPLPEDLSMYEDPITSNLVIDPVVCSDGNTYCRWTIIDHHLTMNPSNVDEDLSIVVDNLSLRRGLFERFPKQFEVFQERRKEYRSQALSLFGEGFLGDAVFALQYVLQWDNRDIECIQVLAQAKKALEEAKEGYVEPLLGSFSEEYCGPSLSKINEMIARDRSKMWTWFVHELSRLCSLSEWEGGQEICESSTMLEIEAFLKQSTTLANMALLLSSSNHDNALELFLGILAECRFQFPENESLLVAVPPLVKILNEGSSSSRFRASTVLWKLSDQNSERCGVYPGAMAGLVTSLRGQTFDTLLNLVNVLFRLFKHRSSRLLAIEVGVVPALLGVIISQEPDCWLTISFKVVIRLLRDEEGLRVFRYQAPASTWVSIVESWKDTTGALDFILDILAMLCDGDKEYCAQARQCQAYEKIISFRLSNDFKSHLERLRTTMKETKKKQGMFSMDSLMRPQAQNPS